jgi:hypothetical protein
MIYTPSEYAKIFRFENRQVSPMTIKRRCIANLLPSNHKARKLKGGKNGIWVIEVQN